MKKIKWNDHWKFWPDKNAFAMIWSIPENAQEISLPHDAMIQQPAYAQSRNGGNTGYRDGGNYTYAKILTLFQEELGKKFVLRFDGVYCHAMVYVNQQLAGSEAYGYSTFYVDITNFLKAGENEIRVQVHNAGMTNSRWYSGSGIYRDVYLFTSSDVYLEPDQVTVETESCSNKEAVIKINSIICNESRFSQSFILKSEIKDASGKEVIVEKTHFFLPAGEKKTLTQRVYVLNPDLWSDEHPILYQLVSSIYHEETELDTSSCRFGIRMLNLDAKNGLRINGQEIKLRGACIHHDSGVIGAATYYDAQYRQIKRMKAAGFNAIRMSHHPAAPVLLEVCDELGMLVMDEFADMWTRCKSDLDYALDFSTWWEKDVELMVRKDINHPCVILYSVGNEIPELGTDYGSEICARISHLIRSLDSTRYITAGINGAFTIGNQIGRVMADLSEKSEEIQGNVNDFMTMMDSKMEQIVVHPVISEVLEKACASLDVAGYNYMTARYLPDSLAYPNRVMVGSETYPPEIARNWSLVKKIPALIGDFTWTGWDYIGESGVGVPAYSFGEGGFGAQYPCQLAYVGDIDLTGFRRVASYYREIVFGLRKEPYIAVQNPYHYNDKLMKTPWVMSDATASWDWPGCDGKPVIVEVYAPEGEVELFLNGVSIGKKNTEKCRALFEMTYHPGELRAVYQDKEIKLSSLEGETKLVLNCDYQGKELIYLDVELQDEKGQLVTSKDELIHAEVTGAQLLGFGSANPKPLSNYNLSETRTYQGRAQLVLKRNADEEVSVKLHSENGKVAEIIILMDI